MIIETHVDFSFVYYKYLPTTSHPGVFIGPYAMLKSWWYGSNDADNWLMHGPPCFYTDHNAGQVVHASSILLTKTTAAKNEVTPYYLSVRGIHFLAVVFAPIRMLGRWSIMIQVALQLKQMEPWIRASLNRGHWSCIN